MEKGPGKARRRPPGGLILLHEDRDLLVVVKPPGLLTIGTDREKSRTAHYLLGDYVRKGDPRSRNRVYVVHRLDQDTSGILLFARTEAAKRFLQDHWESTEKTYLAIVCGRVFPREGTISSYLAENAAQRVYSTPDPGQGKIARTAYRVMRETEAFSLLEIRLLTGRKHQIRVHFAERGNPVAGDRKYGTDDRLVKRLFLHARALAFTHPFTGRRLTFETDIPEDFLRLVGRP